MGSARFLCQFKESLKDLHQASQVGMGVRGKVPALGNPFEWIKILTWLPEKLQWASSVSSGELWALSCKLTRNSASLPASSMALSIACTICSSVGIPRSVHQHPGSSVASFVWAVRNLFKCLASRDTPALGWYLVDEVNSNVSIIYLAETRVANRQELFQKLVISFQSGIQKFIRNPENRTACDHYKIPEWSESSCQTLLWHYHQMMKLHLLYL
jgi:hypothetical protein